MLTIITSDALNAGYLLEKSTLVADYSRLGKGITKRTIGAKEFLLVISGYGKVNTAMALTLAMQSERVDKILCIGTAASINACELCCGDLAISTGAYECDVDFTELGCPVSTFPNETIGIFDADKDMVTAAQTVAKAAPCKNKCVLFAGGDRFNVNENAADCIARTNRAAVLDSETAAAAHFAFETDIPYISIKGITNHAGAYALNEYLRYKSTAALLSQKVAEQFISAIV